MNSPQIAPNPRAEQWVPRLPRIYGFSSLFCATVAAYVAFYGIFVLRFTVRGFAALLAAMIFGNVPRAIRRIGFDRLTKRRAEYADWIFSPLSVLAETAHSSPLFLMIRSFRGDYTRIVEDDFASLASPFNPMKYLLSRFRPIEALLTEAVQGWGPILAFSEPSDNLTSAEIIRHDYTPGYATLPADGWFNKFTDIAKLSAGIIIFPSSTESFVRELQWIIDNGYLNKAVFVMSPEAVSPVQSLSFIFFLKHFLPKQVTDPIDDDIKRQSEFWKDARKECAAFGIALPPYHPMGRLFAYSNGGSLKVIKMFDQNKDAIFRITGRMVHLRTTIKTLLLGRIPATGPKQWESLTRGDTARQPIEK